MTKDEALDRLVERIRCAARGEILFSTEQREWASRWREEVGERWASLTIWWWRWGDEALAQRVE